MSVLPLTIVTCLFSSSLSTDIVQMIPLIKAKKGRRNLRFDFAKIAKCEWNWEFV